MLSLLEFRGQKDLHCTRLGLLLVFIVDHLADASLDDELGALIAGKHGHIDR